MAEEVLVLHFIDEHIALSHQALYFSFSWGSIQIIIEMLSEFVREEARGRQLRKFKSLELSILQNLDSFWILSVKLNSRFDLPLSE